MADYTEEQRVKQVYPDAIATFGWVSQRGCMSVLVWQDSKNGPVIGVGKTFSSDWREAEQEAWADASRRLGKEFVDEVGPLAERKEG